MAEPSLGGVVAAVLTVSDSVVAGDRKDESGPQAARILSEAGADVATLDAVEDDSRLIAARLRQMCDHLESRLVITTGGTGVSPRDVTPEATERVSDRLVPGVAEVMRAVSLSKTPRAALSRAVVGIRGKSLIVNLPGSPQAVKECMDAILPVLPHALELIGGHSPH